MDERLDGRRHPQRIAIVGVSGAGKSRLARMLAGPLVHLELDWLHWHSQRDASGRPRFAERVRDALARHQWICDGNYLGCWEMIAERAELVVWLDPPAWLVVVRQLWRALFDRPDHEPWRLGLRALLVSPWRAHRVVPRRIRMTRAVLEPAMHTMPHLIRVRTNRQLSAVVALLTGHTTGSLSAAARCASMDTQAL